MRDLLADSLGQISEQERLVVALYYYEELTLKEIGQVLELSESRVSRTFGIHEEPKAAMRRIFGYGEFLHEEMERAEAFTSIARGEDTDPDGNDDPDSDGDPDGDPDPIGGDVEGEVVGETSR